MAEMAPKKPETYQHLSVNLESPEVHENDITEDGPSTPEPSSSITELQAAFGSILLASRDHSKKSTIRYTTYRGGPDTPLKPSPPRWTGSFALFSFPRELRDLIYYHAVYRPRGLHYTAHVSRDWRFWYSKDRSEDISMLHPSIPAPS
jgi:hypothetical protein